MATVSKEIADDIIAGKYADDNAVKIVKYTSMAGEDAYGVVFPDDDIDKYHPSEFVRNPTLYWQNPAWVPPPPPANSYPVTIYFRDYTTVRHITAIKPEDREWFQQHDAKLKMEELAGQYITYADVGLKDEDGDIDEIMTVSAGRTCEDTLSELRRLCEMALNRPGEKP